MKDEMIRRERELLELDQLQKWVLKDRLLHLYQDQKLDHIDQINKEYQHLYHLLQADNILPIGNMGKVVFEQAFEQSRVLHQKYCDIKEGKEAKQGYGYVRIDDQTELRLDLSDVFGQRYINSTASQIIKDEEYRGDKLLKPWVYHVALCANQDQMPYQGAFLVGDDHVFSDFPILNPNEAKALLKQWHQKLKEGNRSPLRFDPSFSFKYLHWRRIPQAIKELEEQWKKSYVSPDIYMEQAFEGSHLWQSDEQGIHPDFNHHAYDIFGHLDAKIFQKKLGENR
jgi:exonuclease V gamma subunit